MENNSFFCPKCRNRLPLESSFCPYCMTKFTPEVAVPAIKKKKNTTKPLLVIIAAVVCVALICCFLFLKPSKEEKAEKKTTYESTTVFVEKESEKTTSADNDEEDSSEEKAITDTALGFSNIKISRNENLNKTQKLLLQFYDTDFLSLPYNHLENLSQSYENLQFVFWGTVKEINGNSVALVEYEADIGFDGIYTPTGDYVTVETNALFPISEGSTYYFYANLKGNQQYSFSGGNYSVPAFSLMKYTDFVYYDVEMPVFDESEISSVAKHFAGNNTTIRNADNLFDYPDDFSYLAQSGSDEYFLYAGYGSYIMDYNTEEYIIPAYNFKDSYSYYLNERTGKFIFECIDENQQKKWEREFTDTYNFAVDYTDKYIYLVAGEYFYIIETSTGEDVIKPKKVGEKVSVRKTEDSLIFISENTIEKTDLNANQIWENRLSSSLENYSIQFSDDKYVLQYSSGYYQGENVFTTIISSDGNILFDKNTY
ncbi:MAG: zinc ribbon domain-containing protein [Ruminococcaceae bacterium]|nr:zinc ribbon domain-containing protein [Oscillospiraceae bacterium]